jgi:hypothetical protein
LAGETSGGTADLLSTSEEQGAASSCDARRRARLLGGFTGKKRKSDDERERREKEGGQGERKKGAVSRCRLQGVFSASKRQARGGIGDHLGASTQLFHEEDKSHL